MKIEIEEITKQNQFAKKERKEARANQKKERKK